MKKTLLSLLLAALLAALLAPAGLAAGLPRAASVLNADDFARYASFVRDETSGEWTLHGNEAEALLRNLREGGLSGYSGTGACVFYLELTGNSLTGRVQPFLVCEFVGPSDMNATAISLRVGDMRYDLPVSSEKTKLGRQNVEELRALLDAEGLQMLATVAQAEKVTIRLHGEDSYTSELAVKESYSSAKQRLESASLYCVALPEALTRLGMAGYGRWDENAEAWYLASGVTAQLTATDLAQETVPEGDKIPVLDKEMRMLSTEDNVQSVKYLEDRLIELRYFTGVANSTFGLQTKEALEDIQKLYGMVPTGSLDGALLNILYGEAGLTEPVATEAVSAREVQAVSAAQSGEPGEVYALDGTVSLALNRYWFANTVSTVKSQSALSQYSSANRDNLLLIADGWMENLSAAELGVGRSVQGKLTYDGRYSYDVTCKCVCDDGERFDTQLLPLAGARVVLCAEVPAALAAADALWTLEVTVGAATVTYTLD